MKLHGYKIEKVLNLNPYLFYSASHCADENDKCRLAGKEVYQIFKEGCPEFWFAKTLADAKRFVKRFR